MGFFENLGRKVGEFTHEAKRAADEEADYACESCGERFHTARAECPSCGSDRIVTRDPEEGDDPANGVDDSVAGVDDPDGAPRD